jgi:hypothetical protein
MCLRGFTQESEGVTKKKGDEEEQYLMCEKLQSKVILPCNFITLSTDTCIVTHCYQKFYWCYCSNRTRFRICRLPICHIRVGPHTLAMVAIYNWLPCTNPYIKSLEPIEVWLKVRTLKILSIHMSC